MGYWQTRIGDHCFYNPQMPITRLERCFLCSVSILTDSAGPSGGSDWQAEINGSGQTETRSAGDARSWQSPEGSEYVTLPGGQMMPMGNLPGMRTDLPEETIQNPLSVEEAHKGSIKGCWPERRQLCGGHLFGGHTGHRVVGGDPL